MKRRLPVLALCVLLRAGCQRGGEDVSAAGSLPPEPAPKTAQELLEEQPIDDTRDAFLVDTGGRLGALLVTVEREEQNLEEELDGDCAAISVWDPQNMDGPIQTMELKVEYAAFRHHDVVDANFDGYQDFGYMRFMGNQPTYWNYWIWNEETGQFVPEPEFGSISSPVFDAEAEEIRGWARESAALEGVSTVHRWADGELVCVRRIEVRQTDRSDGPSDLTFVLTVQDRMDGALTEVFRKEFPAGSGEYVDERAKWEDLDYHGEADHQI